MAETTTLTLAEFLLARIADDEADARRAAEADDGDGLWVVTGVDSPVGVDYRPSRVLAECEARGDLLREHAVTETSRSRIEGGGPFYSCETCEPFPPAEHPDPGPCLTLRLLALSYADHPDYREEWHA